MTLADNLVFDLDGTLIDSARICTAICNEMLRERGSSRKVVPDQAKAFMSHGGAPLVAGLLDDQCGDIEVELKDFRERYASLMTPEDSLFDGVRDGLSELHASGFRLAICSNKPQYLCEKVVADLDLDSLFTAIVGTDVSRRHKPELDLWRASIAALGVESGACVMIGDSELDHALATAAQVPFVLVGYGYADPAWDTATLDVVDSFSALVIELKARAGGRAQLPPVV